MSLQGARDTGGDQATITVTHQPRALNVVEPTCVDHIRDVEVQIDRRVTQMGAVAEPGESWRAAAHAALT